MFFSTKCKKIAIWIISVILLIWYYISWSENIYLNIIQLIIGIATIINAYIPLFEAVIKNKSLDLGIDRYSKGKKFLAALGTILITNSIWIVTLLVVALSSRFILFYQLLPKNWVVNIGSTLLIVIPLLINLITFYSMKDSIILYKDYFRAATSVILLFFPFLLLVDAYWSLDIGPLLKDDHSWGLIITAPLFRFLIEFHTMDDAKSAKT